MAVASGVALGDGNTRPAYAWNRTSREANRAVTEVMTPVMPGHLASSCQSAVISLYPETPRLNMWISPGGSER
jgi:hypothetical protein